MEFIEVGDFIKPTGNWSFSCGIVIAEGFIGKYATWLIRDANGNKSAIPKSQAELICKEGGLDGRVL